jgi:hypothetical protein
MAKIIADFDKNVANAFNSMDSKIEAYTLIDEEILCVIND